MNQKLKFAIPVLGIVVLLVIGLVIFSSNKNTPEIATSLKTKNSDKENIVDNNKDTIEEKITTTSSVIGNKETDQSINTSINDALSENDIETEMDDIDLVVSDEEELNQINNLFNENEL